MKISIVGCGKLGLACAEVMSNFYEVSGYDINPKITSKNISMESNIKDAIVNSDVIFIAVPTPHEKEYDGSKPVYDKSPKDFDYSYVNKVLDELKDIISHDQIICLISTVLPGNCVEFYQTKLSNFPIDNFIYNPYLIAMGSVKEDMREPEMIILGTHDGKETTQVSKLKDLYRKISGDDTRFELGTWGEAESIKIFYNTYITTKITLMNTIQDISNKIPNINVDVVASALRNSTKRITSKKYMIPGLGDGGACHPRDNIALRYLSEELNLGYDYFGDIINARERQAENKAKFLREFSEFPIVIVGKSYKPGLNDDTGSYSVLIGSFLEDMGIEFYYFDPYMNEYPPANIINSPCVYFLSHNADIAFDYDFDVEEISFSPTRGSIIVDPWRKIKEEHYPGCDVIWYGNTRKGS